MRRKSKPGKVLFGSTPPQMNQETPQKPKRGRPKKIKDVVPQPEPPKRRGRPKKEKVVEVTQPKVEPVENKDNPWKDFSKSKPQLLQPVEFYIEMGKKKEDIFRGFIKEPGVTATDEPYKLVVLRKKYGNLWYREIPGCVDISNCPNDFPHCEICKRRKK